MAQNTFHRTVLEVEILSAEPYDNESLADMAHDIVYGDCSGMIRIAHREELTPEQMARALERQGSDPSFLLGEDYRSSITTDGVIPS